MIYVTHDQVEALTLADRIAVMASGMIQQMATPKEILQSASQSVRCRIHRFASDEHGRRTTGSMWRKLDIRARRLCDRSRHRYSLFQRAG